MNGVLEYGGYILDLNDSRQTKLRLEWKLNKQKVAELKQKRKTIESFNRSLNISGKKLQRREREESQENIETIQLEIRKLEEQNKNVYTYLNLQQEKKTRFHQLLTEKIDTFSRGLSPERIQKFAQFKADESHVSDQCAICMEDFEIGRNMMRLDCDGKHAFCQVCIEGWFADHNTCPLCRHAF